MNKITFTIFVFALTLICASCNEFVPMNYTDTVVTGGKIEANYLKMGREKVAHYQVNTSEKGIGAYVVFYPESQTKPQSKRHPVVIFANGTGVTASKYPALFLHLASWGFIVIGNEDPGSGNGSSSDKSVAFLLKQNEDKASPIYHKADISAIGISGHSQGGAGVFNAITDAEYGKYYKTAVALSPTNEESAAELKWGYNPNLVNIPILMLAGDKGDFETKLVLPIEKMKQTYNKLKGTKVMARKKECEHGQMLYSADGYVTAWFMWQLKGDQKAAKAFIGNNAEIQLNKLYHDVQTRINE